MIGIYPSYVNKIEGILRGVHGETSDSLKKLFISMVTENSDVPVPAMIQRSRAQYTSDKAQKTVASWFGKFANQQLPMPRNKQAC